MGEGPSPDVANVTMGEGLSPEVANVTKLEPPMITSDHRAQLSGNHPVNIGMTMIAYGALMHILRVLRWFLLNKSIGPVVVCCIRVLRDVVYVFVVFIVIYLAFVLGLWFMYKPFTKAGGGVEMGECSDKSIYCIRDESIIENEGMRGMFSHIFWRVFDGDAKEDARVQPKEEFLKNSTVFSLEFSHFMGYSMWAMYQGLTVILLINILIAQVTTHNGHIRNWHKSLQMNSTYQRVWENVDAEWKYSKCFFQVNFFIWSWHWPGNLIFRFSSSLQERYSPLRSDGSITLPDSSSEKYPNIKTILIFFLSQVCQRKVEVLENSGEDRRWEETANGGLQGAVAEAGEDKVAFWIRDIKDWQFQGSESWHSKWIEWTQVNDGWMQVLLNQPESKGFSKGVGKRASIKVWESLKWPKWNDCLVFSAKLFCSFLWKCLNLLTQSRYKRLNLLGASRYMWLNLLSLCNLSVFLGSALNLACSHQLYCILDLHWPIWVTKSAEKCFKKNNFFFPNERI